MVLATACLGKVMGTVIVAKVWGMERRKAVALGFLMNTKGLVELIVLNIGLSKGVTLNYDTQFVAGGVTICVFCLKNCRL